MSYFTPCNYCNVKGLKERAKKIGKVVTIEPAPLSGTFPNGQRVYMHKEGEQPSDENFVMWCGAIPTSCEC